MKQLKRLLKNLAATLPKYEIEKIQKTLAWKAEVAWEMIETERQANA